MDDAWREVRRRAARVGWRARLRVSQRRLVTPFAVAASELPTHGRILDVGCGYGLLSGLLALHAPARRLVGVDIDVAKVARARALFGDLARFEAVDVDAGGALPPADHAVIWDVLHHVADADALLARVAAALPPGGLLLVKENDTEPPWKLTIAHAIERLAVPTGITLSAPVRFRSRVEWRAALRAAGFDVLRAEHLVAREGFFVPHSLFLARVARAA